MTAKNTLCRSEFRLYFRIYHARGKKIETQFIHFTRVPSSSPFILFPFVVGLAVRGGCTLHTAHTFFEGNISNIITLPLPDLLQCLLVILLFYCQAFFSILLFIIMNFGSGSHSFLIFLFLYIHSFSQNSYKPLHSTI